MNKVEIIITNNRIPELKAKFPNLVQEIIDKTALDVQRFAIELMQMPKSGRTYKRGSKSHQASAPGEAPAIDTGNLVNSIEVKHPKNCWLRLVQVMWNMQQYWNLDQRTGK
jgi:hypothetical protein